MAGEGWVAWTERFADELDDRMTLEQAISIRHRREHSTYRSIARFCHDTYRTEWAVAAWTGDLGPEHQQLGESICAVAALKLGQDPNAEPWN